MAALLEQVLGMRFLEIARADFWGGNVRGDSEHRHARAVAVEPAVNKMQVAWAAASGAHGKNLSGALRHLPQMRQPLHGGHAATRSFPACE